MLYTLHLVSSTERNVTCTCIRNAICVHIELCILDIFSIISITVPFLTLLVINDTLYVSILDVSCIVTMELRNVLHFSYNENDTSENGS